ncbi:2225_t:CDS:2, partial [Dentiscutata erythropus]
VQKSEIIISDIKLNDKLIKEVEDALKETVQDKKNKLLKISKKYSYFYAQHFILGEPSKANKINIHSKIKVDFESFGEIFKFINKVQASTQVVYAVGNENTNKLYEIVKTHNLDIIGGNKNDISVWRESLEDRANWKIIRYDKIFSLFELLEDSLRNKVLSVLNHRILKEYMNEDKNHPVFVVHHIEEAEKEYFSSFLMSKKEKVKIKLCWVFIGPPTSFNCFDLSFNCFDSGIHYSSVFKSEKSILRDIDNCIIKNCGRIGTCVLEISNDITQMESSNNLDTENKSGYPDIR